jgi:hypothetical protein
MKSIQKYLSEVKSAVRWTKASGKRSEEWEYDHVRYEERKYSIILFEETKAKGFI